MRGRELYLLRNEGPTSEVSRRETYRKRVGAACSVNRLKGVRSRTTPHPSRQSPHEGYGPSDRDAPIGRGPDEVETCGERGGRCPRQVPANGVGTGGEWPLEEPLHSASEDVVQSHGVPTGTGNLDVDSDRGGADPRRRRVDREGELGSRSRAVRPFGTGR